MKNMHVCNIVLVGVICLLVGISGTGSAFHGDVNRDNSVNIFDALLVLQYAVGLYHPTDETVFKLDADVAPLDAMGNPLGDGTVNVFDALAVLRHAVNLDDWAGIPKLPIAPTNFSATPGEISITFKWDTIPEATAYNLYYSTISGVTKAIGTKIGGVTSPKTVSNLISGIPYYAVVTAINSIGESIDTVQVSATPIAMNVAPVANAGISQKVAIGSHVLLNGSGSSDTNGDFLTYSWSITSKPAMSSAYLSGTIVANPTFIADVAGVYILNLVVNDGKVNSDAASVMITVTSPATLSSIVVTPAYASLGYNLAQQFVATELYSDGSSAVLTSGVTWKATNACGLNGLRSYVPAEYSSILLGNLSPLTATEKVVEARNQFNTIYSLAKTGNSVAIGQLQSIATTFLSLSLQYYATSPPYFNYFNAVVAALDDTSALALSDPASAAANACGLGSLRAFRNSLKLSTSLARLTPGSQLAEARSQFTDIYARAQLKDAEAIWMFNSVATSFLTASKTYNGGGAVYVTDFNTVQQATSVEQSIVLPSSPASISGNGGLATGIGLGTSIITATAASKSGSTGLIVTSP